MPKRPFRIGFTLVELLVVIGIIGLLVALLLPALSRVKIAARGATCLANLRNLSNNLALYASSHRGIMTMDSGDGIFTSNAKAIDSGGGNTYNYKLAICPEYAAQTGPALLNNLYANGFGGYNWNGWFSWVRSTTAYVSGMPVNILRKQIVFSRIKNAAETVCFGDAYQTSLVDSFRLSLNKENTQLTEPSFQGRHGGVGSILWMDGHASHERPIAIPSDTSLYASGALQNDVAWYHRNNIGYLARSLDDVTTPNTLYFFVFDKSRVGNPDLSIFLDLKKSLW